MSLLADENLILEGAEFSFRGIKDHCGRGLADFAVRQDDGGRDDTWVFVVFDDHSGTGFWIRRFFESCQFGVDVTGGVSHEAAGFEPLE